MLKLVTSSAGHQRTGHSGWTAVRRIFQWKPVTALIVAAAYASSPAQGTQPTSRPADGGSVAARFADGGRVRSTEGKKKLARLFSADFQSGDQQRINQAIEVLRVNALGDSGWIRHFLEDEWLDPLLQIKQFALVDELISQATQDKFDDTAGIASIYYSRAKTRLAQGRPAEALVAAKQYFNVCRLQDYDRAVRLVSCCIRSADATHGNELADKFEQQQTDSATAGTSATRPAGTHVAELSVIKSIVIADPTLAGHISSLSEAATFKLHMARGNLLLLSDKPAEARQMFDLCVSEAKKNPDAIAAKSSVARSIRADFGAVGPATEYMDSHPDQHDAP